jgi:hypothetical protein
MYCNGSEPLFGEIRYEVLKKAMPPQLINNSTTVGYIH